MRAALATARQEAASARAAARVCAEALVQAERSNGAPGTATKTLLAAAKEADATRETQQASKDAQDKLKRRQKELREELARARDETAQLQQRAAEALRRDKSYEDKCKAADASFAAVSNRVAQLDRENARCVSQAKRALASAGEVARRMARAEAAVAEHQARADRAEAEAAELRAKQSSGNAERQLKEACRRAEQASSRASSATARAENAEKRAKALEDRVNAAERKAAASRDAEVAAEKRAEAANEAEATAATKCASLEADLDALRGQAERGQAALMGELDELRAARERAESDAGAVSGTLGNLRKELEAANQRARQAELAASAADARAAVAAESRVVRVASAQPSSMLPATRGSELLRWRARVALDATGVGVSLKDGDSLTLAEARDAAYEAGLRAGDVVLEINGAAATTATAAKAAVAQARDSGAPTVEFVVERRRPWPDVEGLERDLVDAKTRLAQAVLEHGRRDAQKVSEDAQGFIDREALERELVEAKTRLAQLALENAGGGGERVAALEKELAASRSDRERALEAELAKTKTALDSAVLAARTLGEQHDASLKREASREDLSSDAVARSEQLERELVDAKMKLAQTAMELGELRMARSATPPPPAAAPPPKSPKRSWLNRKK